MQRNWESGTGGLRPGTEMVGGVFLGRPRPYMGCSAWESVSIFLERDTCLQRATKIVVIEVGQVKQTVTKVTAWTFMLFLNLKCSF